MAIGGELDVAALGAEVGDGEGGCRPVDVAEEPAGDREKEALVRNGAQSGGAEAVGTGAGVVEVANPLLGESPKLAGGASGGCGLEGDCGGCGLASPSPSMSSRRLAAVARLVSVWMRPVSSSVFWVWGRPTCQTSLLGSLVDGPFL